MDLPLEMIVHIIKFVSFDDARKCMLISKDFFDVVINKTWKINLYYIHRTQEYKLLLQFKHKIKQLRIGSNFNMNYNLCDVNYDELYLCQKNFINVCDLEEIDSKISSKCKKISFFKCQNYSNHLISSFCKLLECNSISIDGIIKPYDHEPSILMLERLRNLPKLSKISLKYWYLNNDYLHLLTGYDYVVLNKVNIYGNINILDNNTIVNIKKSYHYGETCVMVLMGTKQRLP